ncbi:MAG: hypothetical protein F6K23_37665 [Okeania sp. SIO2C9]|uniref:protelomerase family protein n=1 Tax=Okeania sp. SIO2C9 TaxID=2607791 RepID=UPI0013BFEC5C|nr:protelomerase family protein [Okeania sp. SIO2C9]NEQ78220.1 hypothetical protein [Okeania sp. SIO2C9]
MTKTKKSKYYAFTKEQLKKMGKERELVGVDAACRKRQKHAIVALLVGDDKRKAGNKQKKAEVLINQPENSKVETSPQSIIEKSSQTAIKSDGAFTTDEMFSLTKSQPLLSPLFVYEKILSFKTPKEVYVFCVKYQNYIEERYKENTLTASTISNHLSKCRKVFSGKEHPVYELNEDVYIKNKGKIRQHIAYGLLEPSLHIMKDLYDQRRVTNLKKMGFDEYGNPILQTSEPKEVKDIVEKACGLLRDSDPMVINIGLQVLTGFRQNELNTPHIAKNVNGELITVKREMEVVGEYLIAYKGLSKLRDRYDGWYIRPTLAPAALIKASWNKVMSCPIIQNQPADLGQYHDSYYSKKYAKLFKQIWEDDLYPSSFTKGMSDNASHKARAFYVTAMGLVWVSKGLDEYQVKELLRASLNHADSSETEGYQAIYKKDTFINSINIDVPINKNKVGGLDDNLVRALVQKYRLESDSKSIEKKLIMDTESDKVLHQSSIESDIGKGTKLRQTDNDSKLTETEEKIIQPLKTSELTQTDSVERKIVDEINGLNTVEKTENTHNEKYNYFVETVIKNNELNTDFNYDKNNNKPGKRKSKAISIKIYEAIMGIMKYNHNQTEINKIIIPTCAVCEKLILEMGHKKINFKSYNYVWDNIKEVIISQLEDLGIPNISKAEAIKKEVVGQNMWNGKYHRKDLPTLLPEVLNIMEQPVAV